jgi:oligopeptide/dipeptide ABC transporter ATP-binding protein
MYGGRIVETASVQDLFAAPRHPYTHGLLAAIPRLSTPRGERLAVIEGRVPSAAERPAGCAFAPRCGRASDTCRRDAPPALRDVHTGISPVHQVACHHPMELA